MQQYFTRHCLFILLLVVNCSSSVLPAGWAEEKLPKLSEMELPDAEHFLKGSPVDWVVMKDDTVLVTEPIAQRPDTLNKIKQAIEASLKWPRPKTTEERKEQIEQREALNYINLVIKTEAGEVQEYQLHSKHVKDVIFHEDLMLRRIDKLIDEKKLAVANELLFSIQRGTPDWSGVSSKRNKLLLAEARGFADRQENELSLIRLEELFRRDATFPELSEAMGEAHDRVISAAILDQDYRKLRIFLDRLNAYFPEHTVGRKWREQLQGQSNQLMATAQQASRNKQHKQAAEVAFEANRIWPLASTDIRDQYRIIQQRYQQIRVGVLDLGQKTTAYPFENSAQRRIRKLIQLDLFYVDRLDDAPHFGSPLLEEWVPRDLGRQMDFQLTPVFAPWESKPFIQATDIASTIQFRLDPGDPMYNERLDHYIKSVSVQSPFQFRIYFEQVPVRPESLFRFPIQIQQTNNTPNEQTKGNTASEKNAQEHAISKRFVKGRENEEQVVYHRAQPQPDGLSQYHLAEITERKYADHENAIRDLLREKVDFLCDVPTWAVTPLQKDNRFAINKYDLPVTHVIQFNPESEALRNPQLRRAMIYALDRREILNRFLLQDPLGRHGRLTTAPFSQSFGGYNKLIHPRPVDVPLGFALVIAARNQLEGKTIPKLKLLCSPELLAQIGAEKLIEAWARIKIDVEFINTEQSAVTAWDLIYRTVRMEDPHLDLWPFLTLEDRARIAALKPFPDWLRQLLISLDQASDKSSAVAIMLQLHEKLWTEALYIPLWEIDEFYTVNRKISGYDTNAISPYQNVEQWIVKP